MPSGHLAYHFVILPPSLECHVRMAIVLPFAYAYAHAYAYVYDSPHVNCHPTPSERVIKYLLNPIAAWLGTSCRMALCPKLLLSIKESSLSASAPGGCPVEQLKAI